jgi:putative oxidoreductase
MQGEIDSKRLIWPGLAGLYQSISPYSYAIIRFAAGAVLIYHGYAKLFLGFAPFVAEKILTPMGFPVPSFWAYLLGIVELFGGAALALGLLTRPLALFFAIQMLFVISWHSANGYFFNVAGGGWEFPLLLFLLYAAIFFRGAGRCAIDRRIGKEF